MPTYTPGKDSALKVMPSKDPDAANKAYTVVFSGVMPGDTTSAPATFLSTGVAITAATAAITGDPLLTVEALTVSAQSVTVWLSGGTAGSTATVTLHITTDLSNGVGGFYSDDVSFKVPIKHH